MVAEYAFDPFTENQCAGISELLKAVGHPIRLKIVDTLARGEQSVGELAEHVDEKQAIISQQLKILRMVGLVKTDRREGKSYYSISNPHIFDLLSCMHRCACTQFPAN